MTTHLDAAPDTPVTTPPSAPAPVTPSSPPALLTPDRDLWYRQRRLMEVDPWRLCVGRPRRLVRLQKMSYGLIHAFGFALRLTGRYRQGMANAEDIQIQRLELTFPHLPPAFDGYRLLHLTDLHIDSHAPTTVRTLERLREVEADAAFLTGDYRAEMSGRFEHILPVMEQLRGAMQVQGGVYATLGNHDCADMVAPLEERGYRVLVNETTRLERGGEHIEVTGLDDVHCYYTGAAVEALGQSSAEFRIALVHSAEVADLAAEAGYGLYLAGHTHAGQISLPGPQPIMTHMARMHDYRAGLWRCGEMQGYTSSGCGVSALPIRFNTRGEVVLITLRRGSAP